MGYVAVVVVNEQRVCCAGRALPPLGVEVYSAGVVASAASLCLGGSVSVAGVRWRRVSLLLGAVGLISSYLPEAAADARRVGGGVGDSVGHGVYANVFGNRRVSRNIISSAYYQHYLLIHNQFAKQRFLMVSNGGDYRIRPTAFVFFQLTLHLALQSAQS